jgi:hypothetical protein
MDKNKINKILNNGSSSENDLLILSDALNLKINYIGSIYNLKSLSIGNYILLLSPSKKINQGHWVALKVEKNKSYYFDSYGMPPVQVLADNLKNLHYNTQQIQALNHSHCGIYCIYFLYNMNKKGSEINNFNHFINSFYKYNSY